MATLRSLSTFALFLSCAFATQATGLSRPQDLGRKLVGGPTNPRSDRIAQALSASSDAIGLAVSGRSDATTAARQSKAFATLAGRESTLPSDFGRKLQQGSTNPRSDRIAQALSASSDAIGLAVSGRSDATTAAQQGKAFATLAGRDSTHPSYFGRRLQQGSTNPRSDRIAQALSASSEAIGRAVSGNSDATTAAQQSKAFATLASRDSAQASDFGRKLQQGSSNPRSDRIAQALSASSEAIRDAVAGRSDAATAAQRSKAFAMLAGRESSQAGDFGRKLQQGSSNPRSDRIAQALSASSEAIRNAVAGSSDARTATQRSKVYAQLAGRDSARASDFGN